jgi:hypothetical protein
MKLRFEEVKLAKIPMQHLTKEQRKKISSSKKKQFVADRELQRDLAEAEATQNKEHVERNVCLKGYFQQHSQSTTNTTDGEWCSLCSKPKYCINCSPSISES